MRYRARFPKVILPSRTIAPACPRPQPTSPPHHSPGLNPEAGSEKSCFSPAFGQFFPAAHRGKICSSFSLGQEGQFHPSWGVIFPPTNRESCALPPLTFATTPCDASVATNHLQLLKSHHSLFCFGFFFPLFFFLSILSFGTNSQMLSFHPDLQVRNPKR